MKLNASTMISFNKVLLVPYRKLHVPKYHKWMEDDELREQTASERLSLEEEYEMQQTWLNDELKCTFIVLDKATMDQTNDEVCSMIGDANLYIKTTEEGMTGEVGLMIAEKKFRGKGLGNEAALALFKYGIEEIHINKLIVIISHKNLISLKMFTKMGFVKETENSIFDEVTLSKSVDEEWKIWLNEKCQHYKLLSTELTKSSIQPPY